MTCIRCATLLLSSLILPGVTCAAPGNVSVSGEMSHKQSIQITGSGFATGPTVISWDDFEAHTTGTELAGANLQPIIGTQWTTFKLSPSTDPVKISTTQKYAGSKSVYILWDAEGVNSFGWAGQGPYPELYYTFMSRQDIMLETSIVNDNRKLAFLYGASTLNHIPFIPGSGTSYGTYNNDSTAQPNYSGTNNLASDSTYGTMHPITYADTDKRWVRFAYHIKNNTVPTCTIGVDCDGVNTYWIDDVLRFHRTDYRHTNSNDTGWRDFRLGMMWNRNNGGQRQAWFDDLYIATSQARVELCAGSTWGNAGKCEIQIPTAWGTSSITATVNTGAFSESDTAYIYVVDANGDANATGYEVTIGESSSPTPINGSCGSNNGATLSSLTSGNTNNCSAGNVSGFTGTGPWSWTCIGLNGGDNSGTCSASLSSGSPGTGMRISNGSMRVGAGSTPITIQ